jgi:hypothetical protein
MKKVNVLLSLLTLFTTTEIIADDFKTIARCEIIDGAINKGHKISIQQFGVSDFNNSFQPMSGLKLHYPELKAFTGEFKSTGFYVTNKHRAVTFNSEFEGVKASLSLSKPLYRIRRNFKADLTLVLPPNSFPILEQEILNFKLKCKVKAEL